MSRKRDNFRLGVVIIIMFALFVGCLLFIADKGVFKEPTRPIIVRLGAGAAMPEITDGSKVTCFGQAVGEVERTAFVEVADPDQPEVAPIQYLEIHANVLARLDLRADCAVVASGPPLGGKGMLEVVNRGVAAEPLSPDEPILAQTTGLQTALTKITNELDDQNPKGLLSVIKLQLNPGEADTLMARIHLSLRDVNVITAGLARELDREYDDRLLTKVHVALDDVNASLISLRDMLRENRPAIERTLSSMDNVMRRVDQEIVASVAEQLDVERPGGLLAKTHSAFDRLNASLLDINTITGETREVVVLNSNRIDELVQNATEASLALKNGIKDVVLHPWKVFTKPTDAEQREQRTLQVAREFAEASAHLDDSTSRLDALVKARGGSIRADDTELERIRAELAASVAKYYQAEQALWRELRID